MDTDPAKISGGITTSCGDMGSLAYEGVEKNGTGGALTLAVSLTRARARFSSIHSLGLEHRFRGSSLLGCCSLTHGGIPSYLYFAAETILGDRVRLASSWPPS